MFCKYFSILYIVLSLSILSAQPYSPNYKRMNPGAIKTMKTVAGSNYDLFSVIPNRIKSGQNGFAIITTKKAISSLKSFNKYIKFQKSRGFKVHVITEDLYGGGTGTKAAENIRQWLRKNHKRRRLLYVLMLGNPHPRNGDVPFYLVGYDPKDSSLGDHAGAPTDYPFVDLHSNWDKNGDGIIAGDGDFGAGGIDGQWDVLVGRIPFYGENAKFGNSDAVDKIIERTIRYGSEKGDLSWRHNIFYNGGIFSRDHHFWRDALKYNGALLYRQVVEESGLPYVPEITGRHMGHETTAENINKINSGKWGYVHFQGHGFPLAGGGMSSKVAMMLDDKYPKVYTCGACDVASPETENNMMYALLRSSGIASYGGTRSVTGCTGPHWLKHSDYYPYFYFGNSTGEALWRHRSLQAKSGRIGGTNFLINLYGDPSVIPMPRLYGPTISISPAWKTRVHTTYGSTPSLALPYEVRNNSPSSQKFFIKTSKYLKGSPKSFTLAPGAVKQFTLEITGTKKLQPGEYQLPIIVTSTTKLKNQAGVILNILPKEMLEYFPFNTPAITSYESKNSSGEKVNIPVPAKDIQTKGLIGQAFKADKFEAELSPKPWGSRTNFSIAFFVKVDQLSSSMKLIDAEMFTIFNKNGTTEFNIHTNRWTMNGRKNQSITGPKLNDGWNFIAMTVDRNNKVVTTTVNKELKTTALTIDPTDLLFSHNLTISDKSTGSKFVVDELTIFNYALSENEIEQLKDGIVIHPTLPRYGAKVNNKEINFAWSASEKVKKFQFQIATRPDFKSAKSTITTTTSHSIPELKDNQRYFWRVNAIKRSGKIQRGLTRSFTSSSSIQKINIEIIKPIKLPNAKVKVAGYNISLRKFIRGINNSQWDETVFTKVSGPTWLSVHGDGTLFTNYGAQRANIGENKFVVKVIAPNGQSELIKFSITVD